MCLNVTGLSEGVFQECSVSNADSHLSQFLFDQTSHRTVPVVYYESIKRELQRRHCLIPGGPSVLFRPSHLCDIGPLLRSVLWPVPQAVRVRHGTSSTKIEKQEKLLIIDQREHIFCGFFFLFAKVWNEIVGGFVSDDTSRYYYWSLVLTYLSSVH
jgi:hypothetical protein